MRFKGDGKMSRRDTIIIALLVNASLLALLFVLAINGQDDDVVDQPEITKTIVDTRSPTPVSKPTPPPMIVADTSMNDEVDNFLKDLAASDPRQSLLTDEEGYIEIQQELLPPVVKKSPKKETTLTDDEQFVDVTVKRGDALEKIARSNGTTVEAIKKANNLVNAKLTIGQVLKVPVSNKTEVTASTTPKPAPVVTVAVPKDLPKKPVVNNDIQYYTIKSGDNPWKIAKQYNVKFEDLLKLNNLDEERARNLKIGDKVRVK
jgi:peptidoglycan DL-endopeptidase LytF